MLSNCCFHFDFKYENFIFTGNDVCLCYHTVFSGWIVSMGVNESDLGRILYDPNLGSIREDPNLIRIRNKMSFLDPNLT